MKKIRNAYNYHATKQPSPETANLPSLTVPNQTDSIRTLLEKQRRGHAITQLTGTYQEDGNYSELMAAVDRMSEMQRIDYARDLAEETKAGLEKYRKERAAHQAEQLQKREQQFEERLKKSEAALHLLRNPVKEKKE